MNVRPSHHPGHRPTLIALCGAPKAGKTTLAEFLERRYNAHLVDDGEVLRRAAMALYGLSWDDVTTQEGKAKRIELCGRTFDHRQLLGQLGNLLESHYGEQIIPELTLRALQRRFHADTELWDHPFFVFPSVRKTQGLTYRERRGVVIEVRRPGHVPVNDFDHYDTSLVNYTLDNAGDLRHFEAQAALLFEQTLGFAPVQPVQPAPAAQAVS
jgi:tRNA uridine 5-carbamoylmethylation protein Kti12